MTEIKSASEKEAETRRLRAYLDDMLAKARAAQAVLENYTQEQVDAMAKACAKAVYDHAEELARDAVDETKMGVYEDKVAKNLSKAKIVWNSLKGKKSVGVIEREEGTGIVKVAKPIGVAGAITPMTNPVVTPMSNAMFALKGRNAIIIAPHPKAMQCGIKTVNYMNEALKKLNAPESCVQILDIASMELTKMLMGATDIVIATGGMDMVRSVYSSGKPALGVGAGNVQCLVDSDVDYNAAARMITTGRAFDNGIICTGEQSVIAPGADFDQVMRAFGENGAYVVPNARRDVLRDTLFPDGVMSRPLVGQAAPVIAEAAGFTVPAGTKALVVEAAGMDDILGTEKMFPILSAYRYDTWEEAIEIARNNLEKSGKGHSICVHSNNRGRVEQAALAIEVSRIVVNQVCASSGGSFYNGLNPTNTLGCGSWGNNSISENLTYYHLINVSRIANYMPDNPVPTDEEIWS